MIGKDDLQYDTRFRYRVRWSVPTRRLPIPRFTASIYFTITISKIKPKVRDVCLVCVQKLENGPAAFACTHALSYPHHSSNLLWMMLWYMPCITFSKSCFTSSVLHRWLINSLLNDALDLCPLAWGWGCSAATELVEGRCCLLAREVIHIVACLS